jgi:hypothetical protein
MRLADDMFVAYADGRAILLDLKRDRYIGLGSAVAAAMSAALDARNPEPAIANPDAVLNKLTSRHILVEGHAPAEAGLPGSPIASQWSSAPAGAGLLFPPGLQGPLRALLETSAWLKWAPLVKTVHWLRGEKARDRTPGEPLEAALTTFFGARPWFPAKPICRLDAAALALFLWRSGHQPSLVFGIQTAPFAAHCWVQLDEACLLEPHERVRRYTPIMAI